MAKFRQFSTHRPMRARAFRQVTPDQVQYIDFPAEFPGGITFRMTKGSTVITGAASGDSLGNLVYPWQTHDLDVPGTYTGTFTATDGAGKPETLPTDPSLEIIVVPT